jgi:hypothetical protein
MQAGHPMTKCTRSAPPPNKGLVNILSIAR